MRKVTKHALRSTVVVIVCTIIFCFCSCSPTADSILKKYEEYHKVDSLENRLGVHLKMNLDRSKHISCFCFSRTHYSHFSNIENMNEIMENMKEILLSRFIVLDAENPEKSIESLEFELSYNPLDGIEISLGRIPDKKSFEALPHFILMGFKGVRRSESAQLETPAMFVILEVIKTGDVKKEIIKFFDKGYGMAYIPTNVLTPIPLCANNLFPADFSNAQFVEAKLKIPTIKRYYEDKITLGGGKTLSVSFVVATKGEEKKIEQCEITHETRTRNADGSNSVNGNKYNGYDIRVESDNKFSQTISDFFISGKIEKDRITGSIKKGGTNYSYSAIEGRPNADNITPYKSIESSNIVNSSPNNIIH